MSLTKACTRVYSIQGDEVAAYIQGYTAKNSILTSLKLRYRLRCGIRCFALGSDRSAFISDSKHSVENKALPSVGK